ncbi:Pyridoxal phosphate homeostasis protein [Schistosoma japonicum]|uniref:Pyridoxal phosphate homeostasis protein n=1 Tax=Schistosoma japonicum TaxID=6182 RepID=C1LEV4_SCHJA|nr:Pyridoxal phosphate homeostasis protein [Schistosoma japonicum]CAX73232.1 putative Proline synthetase co-transcribed bacterial homolog protein [Schistosoma japonicum]
MPVNLHSILNRIEEARKVSTSGQKFCRLVAVSKEKPVQSIIEAYNIGQRHFGENKIVHLYDKSHSPEVVKCCPDIRWHFIGRIQTNKIKRLAGVNNLFMVETLDSISHAEILDSLWALNHQMPLKIMIQVNTSGELQKGGIKPSEVIDFYSQIKAKCSNLEVAGLMCIGQEGVDINSGPNPDFVKLVQCREKLASHLGKSPFDFELSMGMSHDFEHAIQLGSTNVRIGTAIFGQRDSKYVPHQNASPNEQTAD